MELPFSYYPKTIYYGDKVIIRYTENGTLSDSLNKDIYVNFGYDEPNKYYKYKMIKKENDYVAILPVMGDSICLFFNDNFGNYDNNQGNYYKLFSQKKE